MQSQQTQTEIKNPALNSKPIIMTSHHIRTLLITTNALDDCGIVLNRGATLLETLKATATVLHVVDPDLSADEMKRRRATIGNNLQEYFSEDDLMPEVRMSAYGFHTDDTDFGRAEVISRAASRSEADLILIGHQKASSLVRTLRGTMTMQTLSQADTPVLICASKKVEPYMDVCITTDLKGGHTRKARTLLSLAPNAKMTFVHIYPDNASLPEDSHSIENAVEKFLSGIDCDFTAQKISNLFAIGQAKMLVGRANRPGKELSKFIQDLSPDLLVFATRAHKGLDRIIHGSVAHDFIRQPVCDILALHKSS